MAQGARLQTSAAKPCRRGKQLNACMPAPTPKHPTLNLATLSRPQDENTKQHRARRKPPHREPRMHVLAARCARSAAGAAQAPRAPAACARRAPPPLSHNHARSSARSSAGTLLPPAPRHRLCTASPHRRQHATRQSAPHSYAAPSAGAYQPAGLLTHANAHAHAAAEVLAVCKQATPPPLAACCSQRHRPLGAAARSTLPRRALVRMGFAATGACTHAPQLAAACCCVHDCQAAATAQPHSRAAPAAAALFKTAAARPAAAAPRRNCAARRRRLPPPTPDACVSSHCCCCCCFCWLSCPH